jgi:2'-5' RNA ligase
VTNSLNSANSALTLPLHISLRMSFPADDLICEEIIEYIARYLGSLSPFTVEVQGIENFRNIVWLKIKTCPRLREIHSWLVDSLSQKYGTGAHIFDSDFMYHISLFLDDDPAKVNRAYSALSSEPVPVNMTANGLL